jgi:uncharacterized protein YfaS (alpha-2-macroglobulin family)
MRNTPTPSSSRQIILLAVLAAVVVSAAALQAVTAPAAGSDPQTVPRPVTIAAGGPVTWNDVDRLISEQKFEAASEAVTTIRARATAEGDAQNWTRALVEETKLRMALHGYETAVRFLKDEPWPDDAVSHAVLDLYYANALATYARVYSWEINQRERVETTGELDLKAWDLEQIVEAADASYLTLWSNRAEWGSEPLGDLARYIQQNNYPPRIRGTLRDAVTYLWVELLADSSLWSPAESNDVFQLDAAALIAGDPGASSRVDLAAPSVHPLVKIGALLDDLESWHATNNRPEAALEARLERLRRLNEALTTDADRVAIIANLEKVQGSFDRSLEWWSMGQAVLAEFVQARTDSDALIRARENALAGRDRHPASVGGQRCNHIVAAIEQPGYSLAAMAVDGAGKRSLQVSHKNLETLFFRAWSYDLTAFVTSSQDYNILPSHREAEAIMAGNPVAEWSVALPATPDYRSHTTYVVPELTRPGAYLVAASMRADFKDSANFMVAENFLLSDLVLVTRPIAKGYEVTARSGESGRALEGVEISLYSYDYRRGHREVERKQSGPDGVVEFSTRLWNREQYFIVARHGEDLALDANRLYQQYDGTRGTSSAALLYTDRSVYRPQQTLFWKAVAYRGGGEKIEYRTLPDTAFRVTLVDANGEEVASADVTSNSFGSASGSFDIPAGRLLGQWSLRTSIGGQTWLRVEEYKRPTFEVVVADPEAPLRLNREAELSGDVTYYFGLPVVTGSVDWRVTREPIYPRWWYWWYPSASAQSQVVAAGETTLDDEGRFHVRFVPEADEREAERGVTYRYRLGVDVTDEGGETRSAERVFRLGFVAVEARIVDDLGYHTASQASTLRVVRTDLDGTPRAGEGAWRLVRLEQPGETLTPADQPLPQPPGGREGFETPGDRLRPRWDPAYDPDEVLGQWAEGVEVAGGRLTHGEDGTAELVLPGLEPGAYRIIYTTHDEFGAEFSTSENLVVAGSRRTPLALPALLRFDRSSAAVGETARLFVFTGLKAQEMVLEIYRDGRRIERRAIGAGRSGVVEFPITADDRGGFGVALTLVRDHQLIRQTAQVFVPWDDRELEIDFATFRDRMRPGTRETFTVTVRNHDGSSVDPAAAELLAYMYDRSLDIFAPHTPPSVAALYPNRTGIGSLWDNLGRAQQAWGRSSGLGLPDYPYLHGDSLMALDGYGIGGPGQRGRYRMMKAGAVNERMALSMAEAPAPPGMAMDAVEEAKAEGESRQGLQRSDKDAVAGSGDPESPVELRSDFSETAFWEPHVVLSADGSATVEFEVPDSVTDWNLWVHAVTTDLRGGSATRQAQSVKELMVRPYLPRFLREGDRAVLKVVVNNAGEEAFTGALNLAVNDPDSGEDLRALFGLTPEQTSGVAFSVGPGKGADLSFPLAVPARVGTVAFKITARAGQFSDGELRPLPVLPGRMHLMQSRFVTLHDADRRELHFADMAAQDDPTLINDQLVVTLDAQLFYSVLNALPYLVNYPYECTEQTLNRFLSTGIVSSLFDQYPSVERMAQKLSARETRYETWQADDPNRAMELVETPWLQTARGGSDAPDDLINVLDPAITRAQRDAALAKLEKIQTSLGAFPWFPGGPPSPWMTLYILNGFAKGLEFGVDAPKDVVVRAWDYMHRHYLEEWVDWMMREDCCWETITFLNYVLSNYPDESWTGGVFTADERQEMLDFSFRHWKQHSPLTKGYLALTLERAGRHDDAVLVFDAVMDSSKTDQDLGTYWAPEDRAWLWYNDTTETHAFALRVLTELEPDDARRHGLVHWLLLDKKLNHWKSTRATAEVLYSLAYYMKHEETLAVREEISVAVGPRVTDFVFEPDEYTGARNRVIVEGSDIDPATMSTIVVEKPTKGFAFASATWSFSTERLPEEARGDLFAVERTYFRRFNDGDRWVLRPLADGERLEPGDQVEVQLSIRAKHAAEYVHLRDPRGAGFEPETLHSQYKWDLGIVWYEEVRDSGTNFFFEWLPAGEYTFKYRLRAAMAGTFRVAPAVLQSMYAPEFTAYSAGNQLEVDSD